MLAPQVNCPLQIKLFHWSPFMFSSYYHKVYFHINAIVNNFTYTTLYFLLHFLCYSSISLSGLSKIRLPLMGLDINNCTEIYLNVNVGSERRCVNNSEELKLILKKLYQKLQKQGNMYIILF